MQVFPIVFVPIVNRCALSFEFQLFTFIVNCLMKFLKEVDLLNASLPVGFVFSYPCELLSIRSARLLWWTKGFDIKDCLQKDVVKLLEEALELNMVRLVLTIMLAAEVNIP